MSLDSYFTSGGNSRFVSGVLGAFWNRVFPDNGLVKSVVSETAVTATRSETFMRLLPAWLSGGADGISRVDRLEVVPVDRARQEIIHADDGYVADGAFADAPAESLRWVVPLSQSYASAPVLITPDGKAFLDGVDYALDKGRLLFRENPAALGIPSGIEDVGGVPALSWSFILAACLPERDDKGSNFDFYSIPREARERMLDMLTNEGSFSRILRFVESCVGVKGPTVFEQTDADGVFTTLVSTWREEDILYGLTSGGELLKLPPGFSLKAGFDASGNIIRPGDPMTAEVSVHDRYSDGEGYGIGTEEIFLPNRTLPLMAGETGAIDPSGEWTERMRGVFGDAFSEAFPADISANPVERVYGALNRRQPASVCVDGEAVKALVGAPGTGKAVFESLPAGAMVLFSENMDIQENLLRLECTDSCEPFLCPDLTSAASLSVVDVAAIPRRSVI